MSALLVMKDGCELPDAHAARAGLQSNGSGHHCPRMPTMNMRSEKFECAGWSGHTR